VNIFVNLRYANIFYAILRFAHIFAIPGLLFRTLLQINGHNSYKEYNYHKQLVEAECWSHIYNTDMYKTRRISVKLVEIFLSPQQFVVNLRLFLVDLQLTRYSY